MTEVFERMDAIGANTAEGRYNNKTTTTSTSTTTTTTTTTTEIIIIIITIGLARF